MSPQRCLFIAVLFALALPRNAAAQHTDEFFEHNCASCHTIGGGRLVGPDLKEAIQQKDRAWLEHFIQDPEAVLNSGDPYALAVEKGCKRHRYAQDAGRDAGDGESTPGHD